MIVYHLVKLFNIFPYYSIENQNQMCMLYIGMATFSFLLNLLNSKRNFTNKYLSSPFFIDQFFVKQLTKISYQSKN